VSAMVQEAIPQVIAKMCAMQEAIKGWRTHDYNKKVHSNKQGTGEGIIPSDP